MAGGEGSRVSVLSERRAKPAVPFGGKYRIIDFTLSNCVNSGVYDVAILTQYRPLSLMEHIGIGRPWGLDTREGSVQLLPPRLGSQDTDWYRGNADAVYQNLEMLRERGASKALILAGDHVYKMDYSALFQFHNERSADVTIAVTRAPRWQLNQLGIIGTDNDSRVITFEEKPEEPQSDLASMGIYVFNFDFLESALEEHVGSHGGCDFGKDVIPELFAGFKVYAYAFEDYWRDIGTLESYYQSNLDLLPEEPKMNLNDPRWLIHTVSHDRPPVKFGPLAQCRQSMVGSGCLVLGRVEHSVLFPGVRVERGAVVKDSIVMHDCRIGRDVALNRCILDKKVWVGEKSHVGMVEPQSGDAERLLTIVGKDTRIPARTTVPGGRILSPGMTEEEFRSGAAFSVEGAKDSTR